MHSDESRLVEVDVDEDEAEVEVKGENSSGVEV